MPQLVERRGIRIGFIAAFAVLLAALVELCSFGAGRVLQSRFKMYSAPVMQPAAAVKTRFVFKRAFLYGFVWEPRAP